MISSIRRLLLYTFLFGSLYLSVGTLQAQRATLSSNLLSLATGKLNLELSHIIAPRWSVQLGLEAKPWSYPLPAPVGLLRYVEGLDHSTQHILEFGFIKQSQQYSILPSLRYWLHGVYNRSWFFGLHTLATLYTYGGDHISNNYREGWGLGAGLSCGFSHELSKRLNVEVELGLSALHRRYHIYQPGSRKPLGGEERDWIPYFSRFGLSLVYIL